MGMGMGMGTQMGMGMGVNTYLCDLLGRDRLPDCLVVGGRQVEVRYAPRRLGGERERHRYTNP
jgi:hypothetical protein